MTSHGVSRPVVLVASEGAPAPLDPALEARCTRGRLMLPDFDQISAAALGDNFVLQSLLKTTKRAGGRLHLIGLVSAGGVCSSLDHLYALIDAAQRAAVRIVIHAILDGVDVAANSAPEYIAELEAKLDGGVGRIGTVSGRTFAMAPEGRWERIHKVYKAMLADDVDRADTALLGIKQATAFGVPEQFVAPFVVFDYPGISPVDSALHFNFAADGAAELTRALSSPHFTSFARNNGKAPFAGRYHCMIPYDASLGLPTLFTRSPDPAELPVDLLDAAGHRTRSFSAGAASEIAKATVDAIQSGEVRFVAADLAHPENAGRSRLGEGVTRALREIARAAYSAGGAALLLGSRDASNSIPFAFVDAQASVAVRADGHTTDLAPTLLDLLRVPAPPDMEGSSLLVR